MYDLKCPKCLTPQMASDGSCKICGTALDGSANSQSAHQSGTRSFLDRADQPIFFPVSKRKFILMSVTTFGLYGIFWAFKSWLYVQTTTGKKMSPGWRAWFSIFYLQNLLDEILGIGKEINLSVAAKPYSSIKIYVLWLVLTICGRLPGAFCIFGLFNFVPLLPAVGYVNELNKAAGKENLINTKFSFGNIVWLVIGSCLVVLSIIGTFLPDQK